MLTFLARQPDDASADMYEIARDGEHVGTIRLSLTGDPHTVSFQQHAVRFQSTTFTFAEIQQIADWIVDWQFAESMRKPLDI